VCGARVYTKTTDFLDGSYLLLDDVNREFTLITDDDAYIKCDNCAAYGGSGGVITCGLVVHLEDYPEVTHTFYFDA